MAPAFVITVYALQIDENTLYQLGKNGYRRVQTPKKKSNTKEISYGVLIY